MIHTGLRARVRRAEVRASGLGFNSKQGGVQ